MSKSRRFQYELSALTVAGLVAASLAAVRRMTQPRVQGRAKPTESWMASRNGIEGAAMGLEDRSQRVRQTAIKVSGPPDSLQKVETYSCRPVAEKALPPLRCLPNLKTIELVTFCPPFEDDIDEVESCFRRALPSVCVEGWAVPCRLLTQREKERLLPKMREREKLLHDAREKLLHDTKATNRTSAHRPSQGVLQVP